LLGGKGANLAEMSNIGLPVPPGFTITTEACLKYLEMGEELEDQIKEGIFDYIEELEEKQNKKFGDLEDPLLVSVRSGAVISMPGMMDTILNLGLNDKSVEGLAKKTSNPRFAYDSYRRLIQMFGNVVLGIPAYEFDNFLEDRKEKNGYDNDTDLEVQDLKDIIEKFKNLIKKRKNIEFPQKPEEQLLMAVEAVFSSWNNSRARSYRNINDIPHDLGTAVNVQTMVFGNIGENSGTGVAFTRNPATGENKVFGEFLLNAQGEDVVAGIRTPKDISELKRLMPEVYEEFVELTETLEKHYKDMQDIEFTIQEGDLYVLQTRTGKRTADAAVNIAPNLQEKFSLINNSVDYFHLLGITHPKIALLSAISATNPKIKSSVEAKKLSEMASQKQINNCIIDGPIAFDNAINNNSAEIKQINSPVAGDADILVCDNIDVANSLYKSFVFFAQAKCAATIIGASAPIVLNSRADSNNTKFNSIVLAAAIS